MSAIEVTPNIHNERVDAAQSLLDEVNGRIQLEVGEKDRLLGVVEDLKQRKRDVRTRAKEEQRTVNAADRRILALYTAIIERATEDRKIQDRVLKNLKLNAANVVGRWLSANEARDRQLGRVLIHPYEDTHLGRSEWAGEFTYHSRAWHESRFNGIGGSDIAPIMGTSPYQKTERLFLEKTGQVARSDYQSTQMQLGNAYEGYIQRLFAMAHPEYRIFHTKGSWRSNRVPHQLANVDGLYATDGGHQPNAVVEIKNVSKAEDWESAPPIYYRQQLLWYLDAFGFERGKIVALINGFDYREFDVVPEPGEVEAIHDAVNAFNRRVGDWRMAHEYWRDPVQDDSGAPF